MKLNVTIEVPKGLYILTETLIEELGQDKVLAMIDDGRVVAGQKQYQMKREESNGKAAAPAVREQWSGQIAQTEEVA